MKFIELLLLKKIENMLRKKNVCCECESKYKMFYYLY